MVYRFLLAADDPEKSAGKWKAESAVHFSRRNVHHPAAKRDSMISWRTLVDGLAAVAKCDSG